MGGEQLEGKDALEGRLESFVDLVLGHAEGGEAFS
jgi:hypothetical protein